METDEASSREVPETGDARQLRDVIRGRLTERVNNAKSATKN
jgi:hypothetical protein